MKTGEKGCGSTTAVADGRTSSPLQPSVRRSQITSQWTTRRRARRTKLRAKPQLIVVEDPRFSAAIIRGDVTRYLQGEELTYPEALEDLFSDAELGWQPEYATNRRRFAEAVAGHTPTIFDRRVRLYQDGVTSEELWPWLQERCLVHAAWAQTNWERFEADARATEEQDAADADVFSLFAGQI